MRSLMIVAAVAALGACNRGGATNNVAGNAAAPATNAATANASAPANIAVANSAAPATQTAGALPANFPGADLLERGASCIVYLGLSQQAGATPAGRDGPIMEQAQGQWEAALRHSNTPEMEWKQLVGSSVNVLASEPAAQRDAASAWCVENAPEVDPEG